MHHSYHSCQVLYLSLEDTQEGCVHFVLFMVMIREYFLLIDLVL